MSSIIAAVPWFAWIPFVLVASAALIVLLLFLGYFIKVTANKNPKD